MMYKRVPSVLASALIKAGHGVRFDIGFIGRRNPEISLDEVSRFERETK